MKPRASKRGVDVAKSINPSSKPWCWRHHHRYFHTHCTAAADRFRSRCRPQSLVVRHASRQHCTLLYVCCYWCRTAHYSTTVL